MDWTNWDEIDAWGKADTPWHGAEEAVAVLEEEDGDFAPCFNMETGEIFVSFEYFDHGAEIYEGEQGNTRYMADPETAYTAEELLELAVAYKGDYLDHLRAKYSPQAARRRAANGF